MPKISVIMPVYNAEKYLREAIDSILSQTYEDFEFIIIDDGSKDSSPDIVRSYTDKRIKFYINEHNMGVAATLNRGLDLAEGEYIARMDSDDISLPTRFEKQIQYMESHPNIGVLGTKISVFGEGISEYEFEFSTTTKQAKADLFFNSSLAHPTVMMRREALNGIRYELEYDGLEDYVLWWRISQTYEIVSLSEVLLRYRKHIKQVTQTRTEIFKKRFYKFVTERLRVLDENVTDTDIAILEKYCLNNDKPYSETEIADLLCFLKKSLKNNSRKKVYGQQQLRHSFGLAWTLIVSRNYNSKFSKMMAMSKGFFQGVVGLTLLFKVVYHIVID